MPVEDELGESTTLSADAAFAALGNNTRVQILQTLGETGEPVSFSELRTRVGMRDSGQFHYHLDKLEGHFIRKTDDGYELRQAGRRVIEAILSGVVTDAPVLDWTRTDQACPYCEAPIKVRYHQEAVEMFCTDCPGTWGAHDPAYQGYLGRLFLPPAGLQDRTIDEAFRAAWIWMNLKLLAVASGLCPNCSAPIDRWVSVCDEHDATDGLCEHCNRRYAVQFHYRCTNCIFDGAGTFSLALVAHTELLTFLTAHGLNPVSPIQISQIEQLHNDYDEAVLSTEPFKAQFTFSIDGDALTFTVDDDLSVVNVA